LLKSFFTKKGWDFVIPRALNMGARLRDSIITVLKG
jgi:hypothetical protein